ncbi:SGNH/GDSL hydrolase family protein [Pedobacter sp. UBA5917]|jgi:lysophospholipase L1-like esterase|uniref:SGNH/GDSL hydrolase family protein n=1 Tax=Pedobacter sp. UBA5917 TaxID=1947061 RepID=UPI0025EB7585|nr:SGNH/GDSL hydrolase family protein [Pedobacter sp. UBA5917]
MKKTIFIFLILFGLTAVGCSKNELSSGVFSSEKPMVSALADGPTVAAFDVGINDPNIKYFGRWDFSNPAQYLSYWGGAYIKVNFTGTTVKIKVGNTSNFYAKIDGGAWISFIGASGTINLTPTSLLAGTHSLIVAQGKDYDYVFNFRGLVLDTGAATSAPSVSTDIVEYIGDSITAGYTDAQANVSDYAWVVSESLNAEHTQIAYPGIALVNGYGVNSTKIGMDVQYFKSQSLAYPSSPNWDFTTYTPKIVVINLGQNDNSTGVPDATFQNSYLNFLANIRTKFASAEIFALRPFSGVKAASVQAAVNLRIAAGDNAVHYINTANWLQPHPSVDFNDGVHPSVAGHTKAAGLLKPYIAPYLSSGSSFLVNNADAVTGWTSGNALSINGTDKKEGSASLQSVGSGTLEFQRSFTAINPNVTVANGSIDFWYYVSDVTKFSASNQIEIGSGGTSDVNEYSWDIGPLTNGWNHITKTFATAVTTGGTPNLSAINWFRIYHAKTAGITTRIDALRILH